MGQLRAKGPTDDRLATRNKKAADVVCAIRRAASSGIRSPSAFFLEVHALAQLLARLEVRHVLF
ncbi:MAG: hypothetical protein ABI294_07570, partial [Casimicrobiaceae bacterium]